MKYKLLEAVYDNAFGNSYVTIGTDLGEFNGFCKLHEEDKDIESNFFGCKIAEMRAICKYGKAKSQRLKIKIDTLKSIIEGMEKINNYEKNSVEARYIRKQYFILEERYNRWQVSIKNLEDGIYYTMKNYRKEKEKLIEKINKKPAEEE